MDFEYQVAQEKKNMNYIYQKKIEKLIKTQTQDDLLIGIFGKLLESMTNMGNGNLEDSLKNFE